jgi:RNA-directed DNA polymerase
MRVLGWSGAVGDPAHAGKFPAQKLGDLRRARRDDAGRLREGQEPHAWATNSGEVGCARTTWEAVEQGAEPAEMVEGRSAAKGNADQNPAPRTQSRNNRASMGLEGVRQAARRDRRLRFTALLHHITPQLLMDSFYSLQKNAAAGVGGVTWREYEKILPQRVTEMHRRIHSGAYRATPSRRVYIPKADGRQRPLGIASIEDKIVQQAVVTVLSAIYEEDFLGFSYGFRPGRGQHDALDALTAGIKSRSVNWIVDADIRSFLDTASYCPRVHEGCSNSTGC